MKIHIHGKTYLEADKDQYVLKKYTGTFDKKDPEKELFTNLGFYARLPHAINKIMKLKLNESNASNLKELAAEVKRQNAMIEELFTEGGK